MKYSGKILFIIFLSFYSIILSAQKHDNYADSLKLLIQNEKRDTSLISIHLLLADYYKGQGNYKIAIEHSTNAFQLAEKNANNSYRLNSKRSEGDIYLQQGEYVKSQKSFLDALTIATESDDRAAEADILDQLGIIYWYEGNTDKALEYFEKAYTISEDEGDFAAMSGHLNNIGLIYRKKGDYEKAREYYNESADLCRKFGNKVGLANVLNNIGIIYQYESDYEQALDYYRQSLVIREEIEDKIGITTSLGNIGSLYFTMNRLNESEEYLMKALKISEEISDQEGIKEICSNLSDLFTKKGDGLKALGYYKKFIAAKDSLDNAEVRKQIDRQEIEYEFEKEKVEKEKEQQKKDLEADAESRKQELILDVTLVGLLLVILFAFILFTRFRITHRQKKTIEEKNKEITDSINYAKRIQSAILAKEDEIKKYFPESFLFYLPKDIVAGDFYFFETTDTHVFYAAADCTGHGVPGALVSVVCSNALTRCVKEFALTDPGEILTKTRELVISTFEKSGADVRDGMDISLCCFSFDVFGFSLNAKQQKTINEKQKTFRWSGANNPLWYIENNELKEILPDKQSIGLTENPKPFTTHSVSLIPGSLLFLFTDGFADQFGGEKSKKFKYAGFGKLLVENKDRQPSTFNLQPACLNWGEAMAGRLSTAFNEWKGKNEQTDDVCVIGIRI